MNLKLKEYSLLEILPEGPDYSTFAFSGFYTDLEGETHSVEVFNGAYFVEHAAFLYGSRKIMLPDNALSAAAMFAELFTQWKNSRKNLYFKQAYAYILKYNPIENYSSYEHMTDDITTHEKGSYTERTNTGNKDKTTITPYEKETVETTPYAKETTETTPYQLEKTETKPTNYTNTHSKKAFNSADWSETDKDVQSGSEAVEKSYTGTEKIEHYYEDGDTTKTEKTYEGTHITETEHLGSYKDQQGGTDTDRHQYTLTRSGNIGVMTASQMLQSEYEGLKQDLAFRAFIEFIDRFTYYAEGVS